MKLHRYPTRELAGDYARAAAGLAVTAGPLLFVATTSVVAWILAGFAVLFVVFAARTALRHMTVVRVDDAGIAAIGPMGVSVRWNDLKGVALSYYSTRRDRTRGWMQLSVRGTGRALRLDSTIEGFRDIVAQTAHIAAAQRLEMSPATAGNLAALGIAAAAAPERAPTGPA
ncbi:MAG: hypothetical protein ACT4N4_08165 [Rhodospirillales bacterium]